MWFFTALWDIFLSWFVVSTLKVGWFVFRLCRWLIKDQRNRAYFTGQVFLISQKTVNWMIEDKVVTSKHGLDRLRRFEAWMYPKIKAMLERERESPRGGATIT